MIRTHGLTHIALAVKDAERSFQFYERVFGAVAVYRKPTFIQAQTPGTHDVLVFLPGWQADSLFVNTSRQQAVSTTA